MRDQSWLIWGRSEVSWLKNKVIDMKKDTDDESRTEVLDIIAREMIPNSKVKYFESNLTSEVSIIMLYNNYSSTLTQHLSAEFSILN